MTRRLAVTASLMLAACAASEPASRAYDRDPSLGDLPFSSAVIVDGTIYLSGEIGRTPGTTEVVKGVAAQTRQIFENYKATLTRLDSSLED
ncbi:MAG: RidA family protein, partial [Amphiplicatus sp.]